MLVMVRLSDVAHTSSIIIYNNNMYYKWVYYYISIYTYSMVLRIDIFKTVQDYLLETINAG